MQDRRIPSMRESRRSAQESASEDVDMKRKPPTREQTVQCYQSEILRRWTVEGQSTREISHHLGIHNREAVERVCQRAFAKPLLAAISKGERAA